MAAVNLLVADRAVLEPRGSQVVESRRYDSGGRLGADRCRQIRMTFQTHLLNHGPRQPPRIGGAVRLMARGATFKPHRRVFKREGSALIAMTFETAGLVRAETLSHGGARASMR